MKFCILIILTCILMGGLIYFLSAASVTASFENLRFIAKSTADFILPALALSSLIAIIIVSVACIVIVLFISHRIAGPLYRFEKSVEQIAKGDLTVDTHLRKEDEIRTLADSLNGLVKNFREPLSVSQREAAEFAKELLSLKEKCERLGVSDSEIAEMLKSCESKIKNIKESLSYFKV